MSRSYQYTYYNRNIGQKIQSPIQSKTLSQGEQMSQTIQLLKNQLKEKQSLLAELSVRLQEQQRILEQKQFVIKEKELQLQYIHKENEQLHDKIYQLNQRLNIQRADIKNTIKQQVGILKEEFNFMIKESQTKNEIILQQKEKQFKRKEQDMKATIKQLSQRGSSHNGSFYYEQSHSNIIKGKNLPYFFQNQEEKPSIANSNLRNSRQSYKSTQYDNKALSSLRQSQAGQNKVRTLNERQKGTSSLANLTGLRQGGSSQIASQVTGRFGSVKTPIMSNLSVRKGGQSRQFMTRTSSRPNIQEIISRSKKELDQRNRKPNMPDIPKPYSIKNNISSRDRLVYRRTQNLNESKSSIHYGVDQMDQSRKIQKLKQISSLKMKVNMLKSQLQQEISFCQHHE